jgi:hypothetical protein
VKNFQFSRDVTTTSSELRFGSGIKKVSNWFGMNSTTELLTEILLDIHKENV